MNPKDFPNDFVFGVATSSYQIEGAAWEDGRGPSIWDTLCRRPGAIADGSNGDVACDHYHRLESDLDLIQSLGVNTYRFSIAWPRVQPLGYGAFNPKGLDFYERLIDGLLKRGIQPAATLYHWDLPQALQDLGGWVERDSAHRFVDYARHVAGRLGDRLHSIATFNEPWCTATLGHQTGEHAPGIRDRRRAYQVAHHLLLAHGWAVQALRADGVKTPLGIVLNMGPNTPASELPADVDAADSGDAHARRLYTDPIFRGRYPQRVLDELGADAPRVEAGDLAAIQTPIDFMGINYYTRQRVRAGSGGYDPRSEGRPVSDMGWEIYPEGLTEILCRMHEDYPDMPPMWVTENGGAFPDLAGPDGQVDDQDRLDYIQRHLAAVLEARKRGVRVDGYMVWSLMDNFEWAFGYAKRFGIVHVDYATQQRTLKASARWYRDFLAQWRAA